MKPFKPGEAVQFQDAFSARIFRAIYVRRIDEKYSLVRDRTGLGPRIVRTERLKTCGQEYCTGMSA